MPGSGCSSNRDSPSHFLQSSSTSSVQSHDSAMELDSYIQSPAIRHCQTEADLRSVSREISADSGGVYLTPPTAGLSPAVPQFEVGPPSRKSDVPTMSDISRRLLSQTSAVSDISNSRHVESDYDTAPRRVSSAFEKKMPPVAEPELVSHVRSNSVRLPGTSRRNLSNVTIPPPVEPNMNRLQSRSKTPKQHKSSKKGKKDEGDKSSTKSYQIHGGNAKWAWKN